VHPVALVGMVPENIVMIYAQRDEREVNVIFDLHADCSSLRRGSLVRERGGF